jgi:hypothetical protein
MVWAAAIHRARSERLHVASHNGNNDLVSCASARHFNVVLHNNSARAVLLCALRDGNDNNKNSNNAIIFHNSA